MKTLLTFLSVLSSVVALGSQNSLLFIENIGQVTDQYYQHRPDIDFMIRGGGINVFVGDGQIHYQFMSFERETNVDRHELKKTPVKTHRIDVELLGANRNSPMIREQKNQYYEQYYTPQFGNEGGLAQSYEQITYTNIYPNIDWVLYIKDGKLEYEFVVKEGGNVKDIKLKYAGATHLEIAGDGSLLVTSSLGAITEQEPYSYTAHGPIASAYQLTDDILTFNVGAYVGRLVIDPTVEWTYGCCGNGYDATGGVTVDQQGNVYITGGTEGGNVATTGAFQSTVAGMEDGYVIKLNSSGAKQWGTYFGGTEPDHPLAIKYDNIGAVYIYGTTISPSGLASSGAHQTTYSGPGLNDKGIFLAKFNLAGSRQWSTYYGNGYMDWGTIACDLSGNVYVCGATSDQANIATVGTHQPIMSGASDGFFVMFNGNGVRQWGTYYGGSEAEAVRGITVDNNGDIYISGFTLSHDNIATSGMFQTSFSTPDAGMLAKFNSNGIRQWGTYYCRSSINSIACDNLGTIYIAGTTADINNIATNGAYQATYAGGLYYGDVFIAQFDGNGNRNWGTYLGGNDDEYLENIVASPDGSVYIMGYSKSTSGVATSNAYKSTYQGGTHDGLFAKFTANGTCLWSSYYGTNNTDACYDIAPDGSNTFYMCGMDPVLPYSDGFLVKFSDNSTGIAPVPSNMNTMTLYPNPGNGKFSLSSAKWTGNDKLRLAVTDMLGHVIYETDYAQQQKIEVDISSSLAPGFYTAQVAVSGTIYIASFVVR
ncbi:MAG: SBBP repeat-containing protein [Flavipsychrobacter sp.]|nr:SBBP repeat-containing protein [Flavipsychrobacter sp.]